MIEKTAVWLPQYLELAQAVATDPAQKYLLGELKHALDPHVIQYQPGGSPIFQLRPHEPPRMAVTGDLVTDPVIFNLGLISDPTNFSFGDAVALWIHELGHKVKSKIPELSQQEIDQTATQMRRWFERLSRVQELGSIKILVINPVPPALEGELTVGPYRHWPNRISPTFAGITPEGLIDLTSALEQGLDKKLNHSDPLYDSKYIETRRNLKHILLIKENAETVELRIEMRTTRFPKNMEQYLAQDMAPGHHKSANVRVAKDFSQLEVVRYMQEPNSADMIDDARAEIGDLEAENGTLNGKIKIESDNIKHFHAVGYPTARITLLALVNGEPRRLKGSVTWNMSESRTMSWMPAEAYKKLVTAVGRFELEDRDIYGDVEIIGVISRFFTLGADYSWNDDRRVQLKEARSIHLDAPCETKLNPQNK